MRRFKEHEQAGRRPILLTCGDHDPVGLNICDLYLAHFEELAEAVGWSPKNLTIKRFGLNYDFIERHKLTWIDGLLTGSGKDLGDPCHSQHKAGYVQSYIKRYGKRKVEANALVVRPEEGRRLCREAIEQYLSLDAVEHYEARLERERERARPPCRRPSRRSCVRCKGSAASGNAQPAPGCRFRRRCGLQGKAAV